LSQQMVQGILALLRSATDRVEKSEIARTQFRAVAIDDSSPNPSLDLFRFPAQHRGLIGYSYRCQVLVRIKSGRVCILEIAQEIILAAAVSNVIADVIRLFQREDNQIMAA